MLQSRTLIAERVRGEFREMPGLTLTLAQARRLWSLDSGICSEILDQLVENGFLYRRADGTFCRRFELKISTAGQDQITRRAACRTAQGWRAVDAG